MAKLALVKTFPRRRSGSTKLQRLAQQRNWCFYMLNGMAALTDFMVRNGWLTTPAENNLTRAIKSAKFSVENQYYVKREEQGL